MFRDRQQLMTALEGVQDLPGPSSASIVSIGRSRRDPSGDPFHPGFLAGLEVRTELTRLLGGLDERSRRLLVLWFVQCRPVMEIARELRISRVHCYRLKNKALDDMLRFAEGRPETARRAS
jgi:DNA-directed RNA polymerase specialized sigma24 family protein